MNHCIQQRCYGLTYRVLSAFVAFTFSFTTIVPSGYAQLIPQTVLNLPAPGTMVTPSAAFVPVLLKGMTIHPDNPLQFDFIIDSGNTDFKEEQIKTESERLVKYFLASMTIPKDDLWVNLSPYEKDRIIPDELGKTELGRDMLAQDYILKQLTASLMYPEKELGKEFWTKVYQKAQERYGTTEIPVDTFNKVWILPETATVYEHGQTVYIVDAKLRVMLDSDYMAQRSDPRSPMLDPRASSSIKHPESSIETEIIREIILPEIEREVNEGQNFAPLRQIYHSLILAKWYKETIKESLLSKVYVDKKLINGIRLEDGQLKREDGSIIDSQFSIVDQIYNQYMEAYKKGVFNYIKEDYDRLSNETIPRKYFSGGEELVNIPLKRTGSSSYPVNIIADKHHHLARVNIAPQKQEALSALVKEQEKYVKFRTVDDIQYALNRAGVNFDLVEFIKDKANSHVVTMVDVGLGFGVMLNQLKATFGDRLQGYGVDLVDWKSDPNYIRMALEELRKGYNGDVWVKNNLEQKYFELLSAKKFTFIQQDMGKVKLPEKADLITSFYALQYHSDPLGVWSHLFNQLSSGGILIAQLTLPINEDETVAFYKNFMDKLRANNIDAELKDYVVPEWGWHHIFLKAKRNGSEEIKLNIGEVETIETLMIEARGNFKIKVIKYKKVEVLIEEKAHKTQFAITSQSSSPITPQEAQAMIQGKLAPEDDQEKWARLPGVDIIRGGKQGIGSSDEEVIAVVSEDGKTTVGSEKKNIVHEQGLWHMTSHIYLFDQEGRMLLQKRSSTKKSSPNKFQVAVSGHVNMSETPRESASREAREEIGIDIDSERLTEVSGLNAIKRSYASEEGQNNEFTTAFKYVVSDQELAQIQREYNLNEIAELWLLPQKTFEKMIGQDPDLFSRSLKSIIKDTPDIYQKIKPSSSPVFMEEMRQEAAKLGIPLEADTKIAVFIGSEQITASDHYYQMFKEVVRRNFKFDLVYLPFVIKEGDPEFAKARIRMIKEELAHNPQVVGATITRPWKERFFEPGDSGIGAVNYILKDQNGQLRRMATDGPTWVDGLNEDLRAQKILEGPDASYDFQDKKIVILGSGGSARELADTLNGKLKGSEAKITFTDTDESKRISLKETLDRLNPTYTTVFLAPDDLSKLRRAIREADILINATGIGRGETEGQSPFLPYLFAEARHDLIVSDLISNTDTQMLKDARETGPEGIKTFYGRSMYIRGMAHFIKGWMEQVNRGEQRIPSEDELYQAIIQSEFTSKEIFQTAWPRFGYQEHYYSNMGELIRKIANLKESGKASKAVGQQYDDALKAAIAFTETKIVPDVYVVDSSEESFGAEWMDRSFGPLAFEQGIYIERSLLDTIQQKGDPADMLTRVFVHVLTTGSIVKKRKAQFEYAKAKFPRLIHHLLDPVNGGTKNIEEVLWDVRDNVLGLMTAEHIQDFLGDIGIDYTIAALSEDKRQEIRRHGEELADIAESALHKIAINALNKTIDLSIYRQLHLKEHEMTAEDNFSVGMLAYAANPPTFAHALVAALKAMAESNSDIFYVSATFSDFRKPWLRTTYEKRQDISSDFFGMLSGGLIKVMPRLPHDDGFNGEEKVLPILDILDGAGSVKLWYGAGDDHYFAFAFKNGKVKFEKIVKEGPTRNYNDFAYYVNMPGYKSLLVRLLRDYKSLIPGEYLSMIEEIVQAQNPADALEGKDRFFPVLDTVGKLWLIQDEINQSGQYSTDFTLGMINVLRLGVQKDDLRDSLGLPITYNPGASFEIAATYLRNGVVKLIKEKKIDLVAFEAMSRSLLKQLLLPTSESREYLYSLVRLDKGLIAAKAVQTLFPLDDQRENARHQKLMDQLKADLSAVVPDAVVDERLEGDISKITVSDAGRMKDLIQYTYSVHNGLYPDGRGKEIVLVGNIRVGEDISAQLKDDLLKAITRYVRAYNYAEGFVGIQEVLIKDLVRRDKQEGELQAWDADVVMIPGNDDLNVYRKALDLLSRGVGKYLLISGGRGRLAKDIREMADANGFDVEMASEAQMIHSIMVQMAKKNPEWSDLVETLKVRNKEKPEEGGIVILESNAGYTVENFSLGRKELQDHDFLGEGQPPLKLLYIQKPLQQLRAKGAFNSAFVQELWGETIEGTSFTTDYVREADTPSDIVAEYFRIIANYQKKRDEKKRVEPGKVEKKKIGDWEMEKGLDSIAGNHWAYALLLFKELTPEEKQKLVDEMRTNIKNMGVDDRTVLYKGLPKEAKGLAKEIYEYRSASSPAVTTMEEGRRTKDEVGGIDMNDIDMNRQGMGVDIQFDPVELQEMIDAGIDGFAPVIINITPLPSVLPLLGLEPAIKEELLELSASRG